MFKIWWNRHPCLFLFSDYYSQTRHYIASFQHNAIDYGKHYPEHAQDFLGHIAIAGDYIEYIPG
jgi:hypothetical protein